MRSERIGPFSVIAKLGSGGMADVYLAAKEGPGGFSRPVVVKVLRGELAAKPDLQRMFVDEARISARIQHSNVVVVEELGEADGRFYMVMEYVHGVELIALLQRLAALQRRLVPAAAVAIAAQVASGLHAAHEARDAEGRALNLVHRDVSPQNVLIAANGTVKVIDFGIAKAEHRLHKTVGHVIKGKLRYMAPEQMVGEVDRRTDLYALGVVLWEMLTGRRLFPEKNDKDVILRVRAGDTSPPSRHVDVPHALDQLVMRVLAKDPALRPSTGKELRRALIDAVPDAARLEPSMISALLLATVGPELEDRARRLMVPMETGLSTQEISTEPVRAFEELTIPWNATAPAAAATVFEQPAVPSQPVAPQPVAGPPPWVRPVLIGGILVFAIIIGVGAAFLLPGSEPPPVAPVQIAPMPPRAVAGPAPPTQTAPTQVAMPEGLLPPEALEEPVETMDRENPDGERADRPEGNRRPPRMQDTPMTSPGDFPVVTDDPFSDEF